MQYTYNCNGPGLPNYPTNIKMKDVNVWLHDSYITGTHDYSCPCCRENKAVLDLGTGIMQPCSHCQEKGYYIIKKNKNRFKNIWKSLYYEKIFNLVGLANCLGFNRYFIGKK